MKYSELKEKNLSELRKVLKEKKLHLFNLKVKLKTMQLSNTNELRETKKDIARVLTEIAVKTKEG